MNILEIRQKYPQYGHLSDQELSDRLYEKYYSKKIPREQFYEKIGFSQPKVKQKTFSQEVKETISGLPAAALKGARHAASAPSQFVNPFVDAAFGTNFTGDVNAANRRLDEEYYREHPNAGITEQVISNVVEGLPAIALSTFGVPALAARGIGGGLASLGNMALAGAASSPLIYDESQTLSPLEKMGFGAAAGQAAYGLSNLGAFASKGFNKIAGESSEPVIREMVEANKGLATPIGNIINAPGLNQLQENVLRHVPFSGVENSQIKTAKQLTNEGSDILGGLLAPEQKKILSESGALDVGATLKNSLQTLEESLNKEKRQLYNNVDRMAEKSGVNVIAKHYQQEAKSILNGIKRSREFGKLKNTDKEAFENFLENVATGKVGIENEIPKFSSPKVLSETKVYPATVEDSLKGILPSTTKMISSTSRKYGKGSSNLHAQLIGKPYAKNYISGSVKSANLKISDLADSASEEFIASNKFLGGAFHRLKKALQKDLNRAIKNSGNKELGIEFSKAQKHYGENIAPFEDKDILKFTRKGADTDTLVNHFIKAGKNDRGNLLWKLVDKITPQERDMLAYDYFRPAFKEGIVGKELIPQKMVTLYNNLGDKTKNKLFSPEFRKTMNRYSTRVSSNPKAFNAMYNPTNGANLASFLTAGEILLLLKDPTFASSAAAIATSGSARGLNKFLNSESVRNAYLKGYSPLSKLMKFKPSTGALTAEIQEARNQ